MKGITVGILGLFFLVELLYQFISLSFLFRRKEEDGAKV